MIVIINKRITDRVSEQIKQTLITAADLTGATLKKFLIQAALEKAELIIEKDKLIRLSKNDAQVFFDAVENPPEPNAKLLNAVNNYRAHIKYASDEKDTENTIASCSK